MTEYLFNTRVLNVHQILKCVTERIYCSKRRRKGHTSPLSLLTVYRIVIEKSSLRHVRLKKTLQRVMLVYRLSTETLDGAITNVKSDTDFYNAP